MESLKFDKNSKELNLSNFKLNSIPKEIYNLNSLETLIISKNNIKNIDSSISNLKNLKHLVLSYNNIKYLSDELFELNNLETLDLSYNNLNKVSPKITNLENLKELALHHNPIEIPPIELIAKENCKNSVFLFFEKFKEEELKRQELLFLLKKNIDVSANKWVDEKTLNYEIKIKDIIDKHIFEIKDINSSQKELEKAIKQLELLEKQRKIIIDNELLIKLKDSKDLTRTHKLYEAKLIFVGEERAGKTSLVKALSNTNCSLNLDEISTQGIDITFWKVSSVELKSNNDFIFNVWDFGGQEIYHATHQFFLTKRSIYVIVTEARKDVRHDDFYYWLNIIKHLGGNSPIIVVTNKIDQPNTGFAIDRFKKIFPTIIDEFRVSCLNDHKSSIEVLKKAIFNIVKSKKLLPHIGTPLPKVYVDVRNEIYKYKEKGKLYITSNEYFSICSDHGLSHSASLEFSDFFHDLGVFLHFKDDKDLENTIFLNFEYLTKAVYNVLDNPEIIKNHGYFSKDDLNKIWYEPELRNKQTELLALMKNNKFDLCFELEDGRYLAPQLLPHQQPKFNWTHTAQRTLNFEFVYTFLPKGVISRLIVRLNKYVYNNLYWRYGVILSYQNTKAFIEEQYFHRKIIIKVVGKSSKKLLDIIRNNIKEINNEFTNLEYEEMVPCNCSTCSNRSNDQYFFKYSELYRFLHELKRTSKECGFSGVQVDIEGMLKGTFLKQNRPSLSSIQKNSKNLHVNRNSSSLIWIIILFILCGIGIFCIVKFLNSNQAILWASIFVVIFSLLGLFYLFDRRKISEKGFLKGILGINKNMKINLDQ